MSKIQSFQTDRRYYADNYFPYGIARSGEFTRQQAQLIEQHGYAYIALLDGSRSPDTNEEKQFVKTFQDQISPNTDHERAWARFLEKTQQKQAPKISTISSAVADLSGNAGGDEW